MNRTRYCNMFFSYGLRSNISCYTAPISRGSGSSGGGGGGSEQQQPISKNILKNRYFGLRLA